MSTTTIRSRIATATVLFALGQLAIATPPAAAGTDQTPSRTPTTQITLPGPGANLICQTCDDDNVPPPPPPPPPPKPSLATLLSRYTPFDINGDMVREINSLKPFFAN